MADPITWGLLNLIKKRVKGVQTTLDGVSDKVSGLPDSLDADFTEVKEAIADVKVDVGNVNTAVGGVKEDTTSIRNTIDTNKLLKNGTIVKSVQKGVSEVSLNSNGVTVATISPVDLEKSILIVFYMSTNSTGTYSTVYMKDNKTVFGKTTGAGITGLVSWQVIEFY